VREKLVFRVDASPEMGIGHVMRCLALAQAWQDTGGEAAFVMAMKAPIIENRLRSEGIGVHNVEVTPGSIDDATETLTIAEEHKAQWVVLDGYHFDGAYQREIKNSGKRLLCIDDYGHAYHYFADTILNQNIHAHEQLYDHREPESNLLLGTRFVLLRREFLKWQGWRREVPRRVRRILVTLGGGNDSNITAKVVRALERIDLEETRVVVIAGPANPYAKEIKDRLTNCSSNIQLLDGVKDTANLMAGADLAISAGGSTCWELAFMGLPSMVVPIADNQIAVAEELNKRGTAIRLTTQEIDSEAEMASRIGRLLYSRGIRSLMSRKGPVLVDGEGTGRLLMHMRGERLRLRKATGTDCKLLWDWANDPQVRRSSFSSQRIAWNAHRRWFLERLQKENVLCFIGVDDQDRPVGQIRFDIDEKGANVDVSVDRNKRHLGYGPILIEKGVKEIFRRTPVKNIHAFIKAHNQSSARAFEKAKFVKFGVELVENNKALHYGVKNCNA
jgi:UDP-2,4-diacetamido-2,4,6-trideoxy-beta-L-altropyranose hydrolase